MCNIACGDAKMKLFRNELEEFICDTITTFTALMKKLLIILFGTAVNFKCDRVLDYIILYVIVYSTVTKKKYTKNSVMCIQKIRKNSWRGKKGGETETYNENLKLTLPAFL